MRIAVIVSFFNRPDLLRLCLCSIALQTRKPDQLIVIDDGSDIMLLEAFNTADLYITHKHNGFGKQRLLNKAIIETDCDYLIVLDQDCVLPPNWLEIHKCIARRGQMIYGMYTSLDEQESKTISKERIENGWIWKNFIKRYESTPPIWCGAGSAVWKSDALRINGFDDRFGWCGGDYNFGLRLASIGVGSDHFSNYGRYFHLWHKKPWAEDRTDYRQGDRETANRLAQEWAAENPVTLHGIAQQDMSGFDVIRHGH